MRLRRDGCGWVAASVARACPAAASPPGLGAPLLESCASAARKRSTPARQGGPPGKRRTRGARARRSGGSARQAAGGGSEHVCALGGGASCLAAYVPVWLQWCGGSSALVVHFRRTFAARDRAALWTGRYSDGTTTSGTRGVQRQVARAAKCSIKRPGLSARSSCTFSDPPSRTLSVERGSNHS